MNPAPTATLFTWWPVAAEAVRPDGSSSRYPLAKLYATDAGLLVYTLDTLPYGRLDDQAGDHAAYRVPVDWATVARPDNINIPPANFPIPALNGDTVLVTPLPASSCGSCGGKMRLYQFNPVWAQRVLPWPTE